MRKTVLIVDDNDTLAFFTARNLQRDIEGLEVFTAKSCAEARAEAAKHNPSVVIADLKLMDGNGLDLVRELGERFPHLETILISGEEPPPLGRGDLFAFLAKPYEADTLVQMVRQALAGEAPQPPSEAQIETEDCVGYDRHLVKNRLAGLLAGLRAFGADLRAEIDNPEAIKATVDEYVDRLCASVTEVSNMLPKCPAGRPNRHGVNHKARLESHNDGLS
ncbi:MAG: response regulator [Deltaproteobacteria bacterium]